MFFTIVTIVFVTLFLKFVPIRRQILMEGRFVQERIDYGELFSTRKHKFVLFDFPCRSCLTEWRATSKMPDRSPLDPKCVSIPFAQHSLNVGSLKPKQGDSVVLYSWFPIWGRIYFYYFKESDFVWISEYDEKDRQKAQKRGFSDVEEYKKIREQEYREESVVELMKKENLTREEAEIFEVFGFFEIRDREAKRLNKTIAELDEEMHKHLREPMCNEIDGHYAADRYLENGSLDPDVRTHLNKCSSCNLGFMVALHGSTDEDSEKIDAELNLRSCLEIDAEELGITVEELQERRNKNMTLRWGHG